MCKNFPKNMKVTESYDGKRGVSIGPGGSSWSSLACSLLLEIVESKRGGGGQRYSLHPVASVLVSCLPPTACLLLVSFARTRAALCFVDNSRRRCNPYHRACACIFNKKNVFKFYKKTKQNILQNTQKPGNSITHYTTEQLNS